MPPYLFRKVLKIMEKFVSVYCSLLNVVLSISAVLLIFKEKEKFNLWRNICVAMWIIGAALALIVDFCLYMFYAEQAVSVMILLLCLFIPLNILLSKKVFADSLMVQIYFNMIKVGFYVALIIISLIQIYFDSDKAGVLAAGFGMSFAVFDCAETKFKPEKDEK